MAHECTKAEMIDYVFGIDQEGDLRTLISGLKETGPYLLHWKEQGNFVPMSIAIGKYFANSTVYLIFDQYGIWPSSENRYLYKALRKYSINNDEFRPSEPIRFDTSSEDEIDALTSFIQLGLSFGWGGLVAKSYREYFRFDHDSWGILQSSAELFEKIKRFPVVVKAQARD